MQLSPISLAITRLGGVRFSPAALFPSGVQGAWYDPSDASTLFEDTAGTTPSPTPGAGALSVVGLMLDKSQGLVLGSELVTNGTFNTNITGWTAQSGLSSATRDTTIFTSGGLKIVANGTSNTYATQTISGLTVGQRYLISAQAYSPSTNPTTNRATIGTQPTSFSTAGSVAQSATNTIQTLTISFVATGATQTIYLSVVTSDFLNWGANGAEAYFDNVSVKELPGNHAISYNTTTARPELSARVNLLTYSEQFDNAAWTKTSGGVGSDPTITPNTTVAPDGTTTADTYTQSTSSNARLFQTITTVSGTVYTHSIYVKKNVGQWLRALPIDTATQTNGFNAYFDLNNGVVGTTGTIGTGSVFTSASITAAANGFWRITITGSIAASSIQALFCYVAQADNNTARLDNGSVFLWGADLRPANIGTSVPAYQRIADQYTYDSSGFPRYLVFNGVASGMYTPANLDLSGTAQATVFAGVRKQSDAALGVVAEFSAGIATNNGSFLLSAPNSAAANYNFSSKGTTQVDNTVTTYTAPISNVVTGQGNISSPSNVIRINGTQVGSVVTAQGTGNYGTFALNLGARNAQSGTPTVGTFFNGYLYSAIVVGAASTAAQITSTESWINVKEGGVY